MSRNGVISRDIHRILVHNVVFDIPYYLDLAREYGEPILELGAGLGRISKALVENHFTVTALDVSAENCDEMEHARSHLPLAQQELWTIVCDDMTSFKQEQLFGLILIPLRTIHLLSDSERTMLWKNTIEHLVTGGTLAFHLAQFEKKQADSIWRLAREMETDQGWLELDELFQYDSLSLSYQLRHRILQYNFQDQQIGAWRVAHNLRDLEIIDIQQELAEAGFSNFSTQNLGKDLLCITQR